MTSNKVTADQIKALMLRAYRRYLLNETSAATAFRENAMLANILKAVEVSETEGRLQAIKKAIINTQDYSDYEEED